MSFLHDIIKIQFVREGYLPNYPPHLIDDCEMLDAFLRYSDWNSFESDDSPMYFRDYYPLLSDDLKEKYIDLMESIMYYIDQFKESEDDVRKLPDWVYSYMLGSVISVNSNILDIHDMLVSMGIDNLDDEFLPNACDMCYKVSESWLSKIPKVQLGKRVPTIFGEPHVIKSLRLTTVSSRQ